MRLVRSYDRRCERAREWLSLAVDGELSRFERALVDRHLSGCPECAAFGIEVRGFTDALRAAAAEQLTHPVAIPERRRRVVAFRPAQAAVAAVAMVAVGLGALSASLGREEQQRQRPAAASTAQTSAPTQRAQLNALRLRQLAQGEEIVLARQAEISRPLGEQIT